MSAACCPLSSGDASCEVLNHVRLVATKPIACEECSDGIAEGATYEWYELENEDGEVESFSTCLSCVEIRDHFQCEGWIFGQLWSDLEEKFLPDMTAGGPCMEGLSAAAKHRLFAARLDWLATDEGKEYLAEHAARPPAATEARP